MTRTATQPNRRSAASGTLEITPYLWVHPDEER